MNEYVYSPMKAAHTHRDIKVYKIDRGQNYTQKRKKKKKEKKEEKKNYIYHTVILFNLSVTKTNQTAKSIRFSYGEFRHYTIF